MASRIVVVATAILLTAGLQILAGLSGSSLVVLATGALLGLLPYGIWTFIESTNQDNSDLVLPGIAAITGVLLAGIMRLITQSSELLVIDLLAVILAATGSGTIIILRLRQRVEACQICGHRSSRAYHSCPRCEKAVCHQSSCWVSEDYRCSECMQLRRPLLTLNVESWWLQRLGPKVTSGSCCRCGLGANRCDLRKCGQCPWSMCTQCWDFGNGCCSRCSWIMPDLPAALESYFGEIEVSRMV
jgi:hypothetical protein